MVKVDGATVSKTDINRTNGIVHQIDRVLLPVQENIVEIAATNGSFNTLVAAVKAAGLSFTVLAPTDEAFAKLIPTPSRCCCSPRTRRAGQDPHLPRGPRRPRTPSRSRP